MTMPRLTLCLRLLFFALAGVVLVGSLIPLTGPEGPSNADKIAHFVAYYALALAGVAAYPRTGVAIPAVAICLFGGAIELLQGLPGIGRSCDLIDWLADIAGVILAVAPLLVARWRTASRSG